MPTLWALSDLHLSTSGSKPMDKFGDHWGQHDQRMATAWDETVQAEDIVVTPGDFSWAMKAAEAVSDFAWLGQRPGHKILVKGNHDFWWPGSQVKMGQLLPPKTYALKKTACHLPSPHGGIGFFGVRGGDFAPLTRYGDKRSQDEVNQWLDREEAELVASIAQLDALDAAAGRPRGLRICLFHYPPIPPGRTHSRFTSIIEAAGAVWCIYGHLHGKEVSAAKVEGTWNNVTYRCTSCDQVGFTPLRILDF